MEQKAYWIEIFGMYYRYKFINEQSHRVLRFNKTISVRSDYLEEL